MSRTIHHFVRGQSQPGRSGNTSEVLNPSTGKVQAVVDLATTEEVNEVIADAAAAQRGWAATSPQKRIRVLMKWIQLINENIDEIARTLSLEHGKTFGDAKGDVIRGLDVVEFALGAPHALKGEYSDSVATGVDVYSMRQPLGVVAGITPFNFPAMIPLWKTDYS